MKALTITNKEISRESLLIIATEINGVKLGIKIAGLLLILSGWRSSEVAKLFNISRASVINWIKQVNKKGKKSLEYRPRPGRPGKLDKKTFNILTKALSKNPEEYGLNRCCWNGPALALFLKNNLSISIKPRQARNWLKKLGYVRNKGL